MTEAFAAAPGARTVVCPVDPSKLTFAGGVYESYACLDPATLPPVCVRCGAGGTVEDRLQFLEDLPKKFWIVLGGLVFMPVLFGLGSGLAWLAGGASALEMYGKAGGPLLGALFAGAGVWSGRIAASRGRWALPYRFCDACAERHRRMMRGASVLSWLAVLLFGAFLFSPILWIGSPELERPVAFATIGILVLFVGSVIGIVRLRRAARAFRGLSVRWLPEERGVAVTFHNPAAAAAVALGRPGA